MADKFALSKSSIINDNFNKSTSFKVTDFLPIIFRYIIILIMYFYVFYFFNENSMRFILFIVLFILFVFTIVFLYRDLIATNLVSNIFHPSLSLSIQGDNSVFVKLFVFSIFATLLLQLCSLSIILAVFDYGKNASNSATKNFYTSTMTNSNTEIVNNYIFWLKIYFIIMGIFAYAIAISYTTNPRIKNILMNIGFLLPSGFIIGSSIYCTILAVQFLDNKKYSRSVYISDD